MANSEVCFGGALCYRDSIAKCFSCSRMFDNTDRSWVGCAAISTSVVLDQDYAGLCHNLCCTGCVGSRLCRIVSVPDCTVYNSVMLDAQRQPPIMRVSTSLLPVRCTSVPVFNLYTVRTNVPPKMRVLGLALPLCKKTTSTCTNVPPIMYQPHAL